MAEQLSTRARTLLAAPVCVVLTTINPDGYPQSSVVWAKVSGDDIAISTIRGRQKTTNMERDPRVTVLSYDPADPYKYVEVRGTATLTESGGDELIDELGRAYTGQAWQEPVPATRVVVTITPQKVHERLG